jgi:hypothetical protein
MKIRKEKWKGGKGKMPRFLYSEAKIVYIY